MQNIKAILFDYDNTLSNRYASAYGTYDEMLSEFHPELAKDSIYREALLQDLMTFDQFGNVATEYCLERLRKKHHVDIPLEDPYHWWTYHHPNHATIWEDTIPTLEELKKRCYRFGILSNGNSEGQRLKIERSANLQDYFEMILISGDVGIHKPDIRIFQLAAERMGLKPEECAYVGDTYGNDILGAHNAGMLPIWMWVDDVSRPMQADVLRIRKMSDLLSVFEEK